MRIAFPPNKPHKTADTIFQTFEEKFPNQFLHAKCKEATVLQSLLLHHHCYYNHCQSLTLNASKNKNKKSKTLKFNVLFYKQHFYSNSNVSQMLN